MDPSSSKALISTMSKKWKLEQIPTKKLELENKLMEERLNQLKNDLLNDKQKRSAQGGTIWSKGQVGPVTSYGKLMKGNDNDSVINKLTNRQLKLKVLVDEAAVVKNEAKAATNAPKDKRIKCGQCEKKIAFTRCLECCEDYCANCFTDFHMKGALQKHRTLPINANNSETNSSQKLSDSQNEFQREVYKQQLQQALASENSFNSLNTYEEKLEPPSRMMSAETRKIKTYIEPSLDSDANLNSNSLLYGAYDEKEAQESFKKAVMEWRNSKPTPSSNSRPPTQRNKENIELKTNRNASIGTDSNGLNTDRSVNNQIKTLENQINSNHTLSYAERCLVHKYRRNDLNFVDNYDDQTKNETLITKSIDTDSLKQTKLNESLKLSKSINSTIKSSDTLTNVSVTNQTPVLIEEIAQSVNLSSSITSLKLKNLEPELIETKTQLKLELPMSYTRPDSVNLKRPKTPSSRPQSSRPNSSLRKSILESNLCRNTSEELKKITERNVSLDDKIQNDIGSFLMLDVERDKSIDETTNRDSSSRNETIKVSHMLYEMSPRSWKPSLSLVSNLKESAEIKLPEKIDEINSTDENLKINSNTQLQMPNQNVNMIKSKKNSLSGNNNSIRSNSAIEVKHKSLDIKVKSDKKDFGRNKSFVITPEKNNLNKSSQKRAISVAGNYALSNIANIEIGKEFDAYDIDDGRSSRFCQNEEDENYFGQLETELRAKTPRKNDSNIKKSNEFENINLSELNEKILKNLSSGLDFSMRNEELSDTEMENLTLEELKSLR